MKAHSVIQILYDGDCPICCRKIAFLEKHDSQKKLIYTNIRNADLPLLHHQVSREDLEKQIHAILPDGTLINRMEVIRVAYKAIGLGWLSAPTGWPILRSLFNVLYGFIAKNRLAISRLFR
jgi:predicted DCC family thiol-disulfide oxidoreductase YuxK